MPADRGSLKAAFTPGNDLTPERFGTSIQEATNEKQPAISRSARRPARGWLDDVRQCAQSAFESLRGKAEEIFVGTRFDSDFFASSTGQRIQDLAWAHGTEVGFFRSDEPGPRK